MSDGTLPESEHHLDIDPSPERALAELIPQAKGAYELDLRLSDTLAVAGRFDESDPKIYHLSTHKIHGLAATHLRGTGQPVPTLLNRVRRPDTNVPIEMQDIEITAEIVTLRTE